MMNKISEQIEKNYNITESFLSVLQDGSDNLVLKVDTGSEDCFVLRISKKEKTATDVLLKRLYVSSCLRMIFLWRK